MKLTLTFVLPDEETEATLAQKGRLLYSVCYDLSQYIRSLNKYDDRETIPKSELTDAVRNLLTPYYELGDL